MNINVPECGVFEQIQKISDEPLKECPACSKAGRQSVVERLVSASAFHLKGTGWYKTDYASNGTPSSSSSGSEKVAGESSSDSTTSESSDSGSGSGSSDSGSSSESTSTSGACGTSCGCVDRSD